jgi:hypothetical protein
MIYVIQVYHRHHLGNAAPAKCCIVSRLRCVLEIDAVLLSTRSPIFLVSIWELLRGHREFVKHRVRRLGCLAKGSLGIGGDLNQMVLSHDLSDGVEGHIEHYICRVRLWVQLSKSGIDFSDKNEPFEPLCPRVAQGMTPRPSTRIGRLHRCVKSRKLHFECRPHLAS